MGLEWLRALDVVTSQPVGPYLKNISCIVTIIEGYIKDLQIAMTLKLYKNNNN